MLLRAGVSPSVTGAPKQNHGAFLGSTNPSLFLSGK